MLARKLVTEAIGTFFLVLTVGCAVILSSDASKGIIPPLAIGSALMVMVYAGGHISGGHYNPAVTLAATVRGRHPVSELVPYWIAQIVGGLLAAAVAMFMTAGAVVAAPVPPDVAKAFIAEFLFTFALAFVVLNSATAKATSGNSFYGLAIGFTVVVGAFAVGGISGGAFNPAIALGAMVTGLFEWSNIWIYLLADFLGAAAAASMFLYVLPAEKATGDIEAAATE